MTSTTENFADKISMELKNHSGCQHAKIVELVYGNPKNDTSYVQFELDKKSYQSSKPIEKKDFLSIAKKGKLVKPYETDPNENRFDFKNLAKERLYNAHISVPRDGDAFIHCSDATITVTRLPNQRLKIDWNFYNNVPEELNIEFPNMRELSGNSNIQIVTHKDVEREKMRLGCFVDGGDSFPIQNPHQIGSVIIPINPDNLSIIGVYTWKSIPVWTIVLEK